MFHPPSFVSGLTMISPLTRRFWRAGRSEANSMHKPRVLHWNGISDRTREFSDRCYLTRPGQKPWKTSAFSHHVCIKMSRPIRPSTLIPSNIVSTVSLSLCTRKANGMTRLYMFGRRVGEMSDHPGQTQRFSNPYIPARMLQSSL